MTTIEVVAALEREMKFHSTVAIVGKGELRTLLDAHASALRDAARFRLLAAEAYECVIPHGNILDGVRTAWITKLHPGKSFEEAIDRALDDNTKEAAE